MTELIFGRDHALEAIRLVKINGREWLYKSYPKPNGKMRRSSTGFLMSGGLSYPVKPLGRLANELAGKPMSDNPITNDFRRYFQNLGFQLVDSPEAAAEAEAEDASERVRKLAKVLARPEQAKFRRAVFDMFGARCLVTGCETLIALEAAHVLPVSCGGCDEGWNGIPLRADIHRLFDANIIVLDPTTWRLYVLEIGRKEYGRLHDQDLGLKISATSGAARLAAALRKRQELWL
ncbi:HNH endonuclease [Hansschlegelia beijingensis]|uniref:HNH endonuclease n=1 Tax=Hansschlegelia beijingensis TaxID=1133344 RepID=UPI00387F08F9